jgi:hypothetical protein
MSKDITMLLFMFIAIIFSGAVIKYTMTSLEKDQDQTDQKQEGLENMQQQNFRLTPGGYPETHDKLLLNPEYPSAANESAASELAPVSADETSTGPGPQFSTPDNGKCSPMIFCNTFYKERPLGENGSGHKQLPEAIPVGDSRRRVGFYAADDNNA